ncbi:MAG: TlpA family protein disulfide reductase [Planctomycetia bacterium]|nr:TlpA family protein disulfide reductase [Planctomycetia bacterium]
MNRLLIAVFLGTSCCSLGLAAEGPTLVQRMTLSERVSKINAEFADAMKQTGRDAALQTMIVGKRNEALARLALAAEAGKSTEHDELTKIYFILDRFEDCVRQARLAIKSRADDYASQQKLVLSLGHLEKTEDAIAELKAMINRDVAPEKLNQYLSNTSFTVAAYVLLLTNNHKYAEAEGVLSAWDAKLGKLTLASEPLKPAGDNAKKGLASLRARMELAKKRDALLGGPYFPIVEATWLNGSPLTPEELRGKVVLLDFWAVWCGPCLATFPHLREWHDKYADKGLVIIGSTTRYGYDWNPETHRIKRVENLPPAEEDVATAAFAKWHELKHRIAVMPDRDLSTKYAVSGIPQAVLIDRQGIVRLIFVGSNEESAKLLEKGIRDALGLKDEAATQ